MALREQVRHQIAGMAEIAPVRPAWAAGLRGAIATVVPIAVGAAFGWESAPWMGLAGFCAATADKGGAYRTRAEAMGGVAAFGALACIAGSLAGSHLWLTALLVGVLAAMSGLLRVWGPAAISIGINCVIMFVVASAAPTHFSVAVERGSGIVIGAAWAMVLSLALWPIRAYRPARRAIAGAFREIATFAADVARIASGEQATADEWRTLFQRDYGRTFQAIDDARSVLAAIRRGRQTESPRGERLLVLLEKADRSFARLASLGNLLEHDARAADAESIRAASAACETIARVIEDEENERIAPVAQAAGSGPGALLLAEFVRSINDAAATAAGVNEERAAGVIDLEPPVATRGLLRAAFAWRSVVLRHALRIGVATAAAVLISAAFDIRRGYWVTFSAFIIVQPFTSATFRKAMQRIGGTLAGGLIAAGAAALVHSNAGILALIFIGAMVSLALINVNYGIYAVVMTPTFVLLAELGAGDWHLVSVRVIDTIIGCAIGLLAARLLWPSSETTVMRDEIATAMSALAAYTRAITQLHERSGIAARMKAHRALQNADAALQQALSEDVQRGAAIESAMALVIHGRRYALALSALAVATRERRPEVSPLLLALADGLDDVSAAITARRAPAETALPASSPVAESLIRHFEAIRDAAMRSAA